jgi:quaternary ammonium compound-resistance protein SugE
MPWVLIVVAGVLETGFAISLKASAGFSRLWPSMSFIVCAAASFSLLSLGLRTLPVGPAYAVWTGIGAAGTALAGMLFLGEAAQTLKIVSIVLVVAGVVGLQLSTSGAH